MLCKQATRMQPARMAGILCCALRDSMSLSTTLLSTAIRAVHAIAC